MAVTNRITARRWIKAATMPLGGRWYAFVEARE
jgi:hypothetical protein